MASRCVTVQITAFFFLGTQVYLICISVVFNYQGFPACVPINLSDLNVRGNSFSSYGEAEWAFTATQIALETSCVLQDASYVAGAGCSRDTIGIISALFKL